ncbi:hypothetical protein KTP48_09975 [Proteus mirabilis]|uniref:hypothetical protein n=2 Tax=Proteus mirabilis TaxID=584 RepID=UPI001C2BF345|nr:hypothetical protein [Proteus mirabilis]MBU9979068.1 hypothetical protein [Proteus mirabilis]
MTISRQFNKNRKSLSDKVCRFFYEEALNNKTLSLILNKVDLFDISNIYAFGGVVRDIELRNTPSDIDLVFNGDRDSFNLLLNYLNNEKIAKNKFGGFRIETNGLDIDLWHFEDTWAFLNNKVETSDNHINNILKTTFFNWDAVLFDLKKQNVIYNDDYCFNLKNKFLKINLFDNPNVIGAFSRIIKNIFYNQANYLSEDVLIYLYKSFEDYSLSEIREFYLDKNKKCKLQTRQLINLYDKVNFTREYNQCLKNNRDE